MKPRLFVGSSSESVHIAESAHQNLQAYAEVTVWNQGVFDLSRSTSESLNETLDTWDFSIFVFSPDDLLTIRGEESTSVRDNVIYELGLFTGRLGRDRCFILAPDKSDELRIPTDLMGVTVAHYETLRSDNNWQAATGPACAQIRDVIQRLGPKSRALLAAGSSANPPEAAVNTALDSKLESEPPVEQIGGDGLDEENKYAWIRAYIEGRNEEALELLNIHISSVENDAELLKFLECWVGRVMYGINPSEGTQHLESLIENKALYPITILPSLNRHTKEVLAQRNMVLVQDLLQYSVPDLIRKFSIRPKTAHALRGEVEQLCII